MLAIRWLLAFLLGSAIMALPLLLGLSVISYGQGAPPPSSSPTVSQVKDKSTGPPYILENPPPPPPTKDVTDRYLTSPELTLTMMVIVLALVTLTMQFVISSDVLDNGASLPQASTTPNLPLSTRPAPL